MASNQMKERRATGIIVLGRLERDGDKLQVWLQFQYPASATGATLTLDGKPVEAEVGSISMRYPGTMRSSPVIGIQHQLVNPPKGGLGVIDLFDVNGRILVSLIAFPDGQIVLNPAQRDGMATVGPPVPAIVQIIPGVPDPMDPNSLVPFIPGGAQPPTETARA